jgi:hypothetical protein
MNTKQKIKLIILIIASKEEIYEEFQKAQRNTWIKDIENRNDIKYFYVYNGHHKFEVINDKIFCVHEENINNILKKTIDAFNYINENYDYDYILRTNLCSYFIIDNLLKKLENKPKENLYWGVINYYFNPINYISGTCIILTKDLIKKIITNREKINYNNVEHMSIGTPVDDMSLGIFLNYDYKYIDAHRIDIEYNDLNYNELDIDNFYHIRFKSNNRKIDIKRMYALNNYLNNMKKNQTCLAIISYCDTKEKQNILLNTIKTLKQNCDLPIILSSNRIKLEKDLYEDVNYYIYDETNSISKKTIISWVNTHGHTLIRNFYDYGYAVIRHIKICCNFLLNSNYKYIILINYDIVLNNEIFNEIEKYTNNNYDKIALTYKTNLRYSNVDSEKYLNLCPNLFMFEIDKFINEFNIKLEDYVYRFYMFENFLYNVFNVNNVEISNKNIEASIDSRQIIDGIINFELFSVYAYNNDNKINLFIYNLQNIFDFGFTIKTIKDNIEIPVKLTFKDFILYDVFLYYTIIETNINVNNSIIIKYNGIEKTLINIQDYTIIDYTKDIKLKL